jgi:hypothetical protein
MNKYGSFVLLASLIVISPVLACEYGSIAGTGTVNADDFIQPLTPAQITIVEANITIETNEFGDFSIPYLRSGTYTMKLQWCKKYCLLENITVRGNATTIIDLDMRYNALADPDFTGSVKERPIDSSKTYSGATTTSYDIGRSPATTLDELIQFQPGIVTSDYGLHLRGSTSDDITYYVDGLIFMWPYITGRQHIPMPLSMIEELSLQSEGIESEYGEMRAGIVNIVTRQAGTKHTGRIDYFTDEIFCGDRLNFGYNNYGISLSGPLPANFSYFLSGNLLFHDAFQEARYKIRSPRNDYHGYGKLTYQLPGARGQISLSGFRAREQWVRWSPYIEPGNDLKYFNQRPMTRTKYWYGMAALDYRFSSKNLTSLRIGIDHFDRCYGNRDYVWEEANDHTWYDDYQFKAEHLIAKLLDKEWQEQNSVSIRDILVDSIRAYHTEGQNRGSLALRANPWGVEGRFYTYGDYRAWSYSQHENIQTRLDVNQHFSRYYTLKSGIHFIKYDNHYYNNPLAWHDAPFWDYYIWEPYRIDGYLQNNITYEKASAKIGVRLDYFNSNNGPLIDTTPIIPDTTESEMSLKISPRLGLALLVGNRMKLGFDYEQYLRVYHRYTPLQPLTYRTITYMVFADYNILSNTGIGCNLYYRRYNDWMQMKNDQYEYNLYGNSEYDDYVGVMGMQIDIRSQLMKYLTLNIAYNLQSAYGSNIDWYWGGGYVTDDVPADFDERHQLRIELHLDLPPHRDFKLFKSFNSTLSLRLFSGQPYTPVDLRGNPVADKNSSRIPSYWNVDWKLTRRFRIGRANLVLSALVLNLFNTRQVIDVYNTTGDPDDHGDLLPSVDQFVNTAMSSMNYSPQADHNHDGLITPVEARDAYIGALHDLYSDPTNYGNPLQIRLGAGIEF